MQHSQNISSSHIKWFPLLEWFMSKTSPLFLWIFPPWPLRQRPPTVRSSRRTTSRATSRCGSRGRARSAGRTWWRVARRSTTSWSRRTGRWEGREMRWGSPPVKGDTHIHIYMQSTPDIYMVNICCDKVISWVIFNILTGHYHPRSRLINTFHIRFHRYSNFLRFVRKPWGTSEGEIKKIKFSSVL